MAEVGAIGRDITARHHFLCRMAGELAGMRILDIGCGFGWFEGFAVENGCARVVGLDPDEAQLEYARERVPGAEFVAGDALAVPAAVGAGFDMVTMFDVLEHLPRGAEVDALSATCCVLTSGGRLLISVPYRGLASTALDPAFYFGHRHYSEEAVREIVERAGLSVERAAYGGGLWESASLIWLYVFKWVFRREMPLKSFLEERREKEYSSDAARPNGPTTVTMFLEARKGV